ncbi:MAG: Gfo/Idh/MocA family protein, partial [bacterium]
MTIDKPVRACLVGIGGYGRTHLRAFDELSEEGLAELTAVVVRSPGKYPQQVERLAERGVRCFTRYDEALAERNFDFVALCTPLHLHRPMTVDALDAGVPVLCEKSAAPTVQDVQAMIDAEERTGLPVDIAYNHQNSSVVRALQTALIDGRIGRVTDIVVRGAWLRTDRYYQRSAWAGRARVNDLWALDGPVNNPLAHYLFCALFLASSEPGHVANPVRVRGELYRARPTIEGEDTACIRAELDNGATVHYYVTLVAPAENPYRRVRLDVIGENGSVTWRAGDNDSPARAALNDGGEVAIEHDGRPGSTRRAAANFARYLLGESDTLFSPLVDSLRFARVSNGAFDSSREVHQVPQTCVEQHKIPVDAGRA